MLSVSVKNLVIGICFTFVLLFSANAFAQGFYLNASVGRSEVDDIGGLSFDEGTAYTLGAGYSIIENFAVEASYIDFGEFDDGTYPNWIISGDAVMILAVAKVPVTKLFTIYGKLGFFSWDAKVTEAGWGKLASDDGTDITWAAGAMVNFTERVSVFGQYQVFDFDLEGESVDVDNTSIGLQYHF